MNTTYIYKLGTKPCGTLNGRLLFDQSIICRLRKEFKKLFMVKIDEFCDSSFKKNKRTRSVRAESIFYVQQVKLVFVWIFLVADPKFSSRRVLIRQHFFVYFFGVLECVGHSFDKSPIRGLSREPRKRRPTRCRFPRRDESAGPVSPTCNWSKRPKAGNAP